MTAWEGVLRWEEEKKMPDIRPTHLKLSSLNFPKIFLRRTFKCMAFKKIPKYPSKWQTGTSTKLRNALQ